MKWNPENQFYVNFSYFRAEGQFDKFVDVNWLKIG